MTEKQINIIKGVVGAVFVVLGATGVVFPDGAEAGVNDALTAVGALVLLFTSHKPQ